MCLACVSRASRLRLACVSRASRLRLACFSHASRVRLACVSRASRSSSCILKAKSLNKVASTTLVPSIELTLAGGQCALMCLMFHFNYAEKKNPLRNAAKMEMRENCRPLVRGRAQLRRFQWSRANKAISAVATLAVKACERQSGRNQILI